LGVRWRPAGPSFFLTTSNEVCDAILAVSDGHNNVVLRTHVARIDDPRLRQAFAAAVGLQQTSELLQESTKSKRGKDRDLWKGLPRK
jgi:hypothetical protein